LLVGTKPDVGGSAFAENVEFNFWPGQISRRPAKWLGPEL